MKITLTILSLLLVFVGTSFAQTPSDTAKNYFQVFQNGEYEKAAAFFAPAALKDFREMLNFGAALPEEQASQFYGTFFGPGSTRESVAAMSDVEFFSGFLGFVMKQAEAVGGVNFDEVEILGEVTEGEIVHVLTRSHVSVGELEMESMEVVSFSKIDGSWKTLLSGKMKGMAAQLKSAFNQ